MVSMIWCIVDTKLFYIWYDAKHRIIDTKLLYILNYTGDEFKNYKWLREPTQDYKLWEPTQVDTIWN